MLYALKIATRYLTASKAQTSLLVLGVAVGVFIFIFMSALIGGLAEFIVSRTVGDISHVTITAEDRDPAVLVTSEGHVLVAPVRGRARAATLSDAATFIPLIETVPGVKAVSPQVSGAGFLTRGAQVAQVSVTGLEPGRESAILNLRGYMVGGHPPPPPPRASGHGRDRSRGDTGRRAFRSGSGRRCGCKSSAGASAVLTVGGIYETGNGTIDGSSVYVSLSTARTLFMLPQGLTRIEIKLADLNNADATAERIAALTGLDAVPWTDGAEQLMEALDAQAQTGYFLKSFALVTIVIGVASALLLSTYRRRPEIGIMRGDGGRSGLRCLRVRGPGCAGWPARGAFWCRLWAIWRCFRFPPAMPSSPARCPWTSPRAPTGWRSRSR